MEDTQRCIETCSSPLMKAQNYIQSQVENFQVSRIIFIFWDLIYGWSIYELNGFPLCQVGLSIVLNIDNYDTITIKGTTITILLPSKVI